MSKRIGGRRKALRERQELEKLKHEEWSVDYDARNRADERKRKEAQLVSNRHFSEGMLKSVEQLNELGFPCTAMQPAMLMIYPETLRRIVEQLTKNLDSVEEETS